MIEKVYISVVLVVLAITAALLNISSINAQPVSGPTIAEFMADPSQVSDARGEWIEIVNQTDTTIDLTGWDIDGSTISGNLALEPNKAVVICKNADVSLNGGVVCDGVSGYSLTNTTDTISLRDVNNQVVHSVSYSQTDIALGKSTNVTNSQYSLTTTFQYGDGDFGSPAKNEFGHILTHAVLERNANRRPDFFGGETFSAGYKYDLYRISASDWELWNTGVTTDSNFPSASWLSVSPGEYAVCLEVPDAHFATFASRMKELFVMEDTTIDRIVDSATGSSQKCGKFQVSASQFTHNYLGLKKMVGTSAGIQVHVLSDNNGDSAIGFMLGETLLRNWTVKVYRQADWQAGNAPQQVLVTQADNKYSKYDTGQEVGKWVACLEMTSGYTNTFARKITSIASSDDIHVANTNCAEVDLIRGEIQTVLFGVDLL